MPNTILKPTCCCILGLNRRGGRYSQGALHSRTLSALTQSIQPLIILVTDNTIGGKGLTNDIDYSPLSIIRVMTDFALVCVRVRGRRVGTVGIFLAPFALFATLMRVVYAFAGLI